MPPKREDKIFEDLLRRNDKPFWASDPDDPMEHAEATRIGKPPEGPPTAPVRTGARHARRRRAWVPVLLLGLFVGGLAGLAWPSSQHATPLAEEPPSVEFRTVTAKPTPRPVVTRTRWRTREVPGPVRWKTPSPGPTVWRTLPPPAPRPQPTKTVHIRVTVTKTIIREVPVDARSDFELPGS